MRKLGEAYDPEVHNIVVGDFNFVTTDADRIAKTSADCNNNSTDKSNTETWNDLNTRLGLQEFVQERYTCENSFGWSRIDRAYTKLAHCGRMLESMCVQLVATPKAPF